MGLLTRSPAERRRRRQRGMMWVLTAMTMVVLVIIALMIKDIAKTPTAARQVALSGPERPQAAAPPRPHASRSPRAFASLQGSAALRGSAAPMASLSASPSASPTGFLSPSPSASPAASAEGGQVTDSSSGLSYLLLSSPWQPGCPGALNTPMFSWTAGESAIAGLVSVAGSATDWYGNACSGLLQEQEFQYSGPADLESTAMSLAGVLDQVYYSALPHDRTLESSSEIDVSGHPAWAVTFLITYPDAASEGMAWTSEAGAVVVVDRGDGQVPAVFYVSVPANLGTGAVGTLISSLSLS
ncbi:MAG TPA: hypothetical protein VEJ42_01450 [Streptosporangiaceae bacterium]|nr:hypothetical protein [Streptosporangiaceae bacterium]